MTIRVRMGSSHWSALAWSLRAARLPHCRTYRYFPCAEFAVFAAEDGVAPGQRVRARRAWPRARVLPADGLSVAPLGLAAGSRCAHQSARCGEEGAGASGGAERAAGAKAARAWGRHHGGAPTRQQLDLNQELHRCSSLEQILGVIERAKTQKVTPSTVNIITAVNKIAKLRTPGQRPRAEELLLVRSEVVAGHSATCDDD